MNAIGSFQDGGKAPVSERFEKSLNDLSDVYRKHRQYIKEKYQVSAIEMDIIQLIVLHGKKKMKEIGEHFNIKLSTLTSIIDKIEDQKLVKRVNSKEDRRVVYLDVTGKGKRQYNDYCRYIQAVSKVMNESLKEKEVDVFLLSLKKFAEIAYS
jgi:DNA-binding MarR family transcriptional regulator